jgi:thiamine biosynthesis lipoprotein
MVFASRLLLTLLAAGLLGVPTGPRPPQEYTEVHMGVPVRVVVYAGGETKGRAAARAAFDRIAALERVMSDYRPDSELRRLEARPAEWVDVSPELFEVMARAIEIARATDGAFDPSVGPLVALWREARRSGRLPEASALARARGLTGWRRIDLDAARRAIRLGVAGMRLDLGGIAKGYILQHALRTLHEHGVARALLEAGGDIVVGDAPPDRPGWRVDAPGADAAFAARAASLTNAALATSGSAMQFVEIDGVRYSHVVDPRTGLGLTNHLQARVIASDGATADALSTALTVLGPTRARAVLARFPGVTASLTHEEPARPQVPRAAHWCADGRRDRIPLARCGFHLQAEEPATSQCRTSTSP